MKNFLLKPIPIWALILTFLITGAASSGIWYLFWGERNLQPTTLFPEQINAGEKMTFFDWWYVQAGYSMQNGEIVNYHLPTGVNLQYYSATNFTQILKADQPWESNFLGLYTTLLYDDGKYRLWYESYPNLEEQKDSNAIFCYAESLDGTHWTKPNLGIASFDGITETNILFTPEMHPRGIGLHGVTVFKDPHGSEAERYKLTYCGRELIGRWIVYGGVSPDGLHWTLIDDYLVLEDADSQSTVYWDESRQCYVGYFRHWEQDRRHITYSETNDFHHWPTPRFLFGSEGYLDPSTDYYTNGYHAWPGCTSAHIMLPTMYYRGSQILPGDHLCPSMAVSRNGLNWYFPLDDPFILPGTAGSGREGMIFVGSGMAALSNGTWILPLGCANETHNSNRASGNYENSIQLAYLRPDGFAAIEANSDGEFWTIPLTFQGDSLHLNCVTDPDGFIKLAIIDEESSQVISGYNLTDCENIQGDFFDHTIRWNGNEQILNLNSGKRVLHISMNSARIYSIWSD